MRNSSDAASGTPCAAWTFLVAVAMADRLSAPLNEDVAPKARRAELTGRASNSNAIRLGDSEFWSRTCCALSRAAGDFRNTGRSERKTIVSRHTRKSSDDREQGGADALASSAKQACHEERLGGRGSFSGSS